MTRVNAADPFGLVGQILDGQFRVDRLVGEGGFSVVYKGHHQGLNEPIAIKCLKLPSALGTSLVDSFVQRFRDESRILYRLSQGNLHIVRSVAAGTTQAPYTGALVPYMVLEWLDGRSLQNDLTVRRTIGSGGRSLDDVVALFAGAADALGYAHQQGVVHRDLNPGNIFLAATPRGTSTKVLDFGVAKIMHDSALNLGPRAQTIGQIRIFAPAYGAPEQFDDRIGPVAAPSDVYSFALILLEVLRDRPVNDAGHLGAFAQLAVDAARRPTPHALGMAVPDEVEAVFARATRLDPRERWPVVGELWQALTAAIKVATERRYRQAALATPSLPMGPVSLPGDPSMHGAGADRTVDLPRAGAPSAASFGARPSVDPKKTMPLGSPGFALRPGDSAGVTPPPASVLPVAPGAMSAVAPPSATSSSAKLEAARDPRRTMMLAGGPPRLGAAPSPSAPSATIVDEISPVGPSPSSIDTGRPSTDALADAKRRLGSTFVMDHAPQVQASSSFVPGGTSQVHAGSSFVPGGTSQVQAGSSLVPGGTSQVQASSSFVPEGTSQVQAGSSLVPGGTSQVHAGSQPVTSMGESSPITWPSDVAEAPPTLPRRGKGALAVLAVIVVLAVGAIAYVVFAKRASDAGASSGAASSSAEAVSTAPEIPPAPSGPDPAPTSDPIAAAVPVVAPVASEGPASPPEAPSTPSDPSPEPPDPSKAAPASDPHPSPAPGTPMKGSTPSGAVAPAAPAKADPNAFDEAAARSRLSSANSVLVVCKRTGGLAGKGSASVTFGRDGAVSSVVIAPPFAGTKEGSCAAGQFQRVKVQPFTGAARTLEHAFEIPK